MSPLQDHPHVGASLCLPLRSQLHCSLTGRRLDPAPLPQPPEWQAPGGSQEWASGTVCLFPTPSLQQRQARVTMRGQGREWWRFQAWEQVLPSHTKVGADVLGTPGHRGRGAQGSHGSFSRSCCRFCRHVYCPPTPSAAAGTMGAVAPDGPLLPSLVHDIIFGGKYSGL